MSEPVSSAGGLDRKVRAALRRLVLGLADSKRILGIRYSDWLLGAPSVETAIAASAMAQDEWGHARLLYAMLKDFDLDPMAYEHERAPEQYASVDPLDHSFEDWAEVVAGIVLVDGALTIALDAFSRGLYEPARSRVPKMISEEAFHADMGRAWFRRLARGREEARGRLEESSRRILGRTLAWLGPDDEAHRTLAELGMTDPAPSLRSAFLESVGTLLADVGIEASEVEPETEGWDEERGRGPGGPDEDAVVRARGDLNRDLFVE